MLQLTPICNERGERLLAVHEVANAEACSATLSFALIMVRDASSVLLVHNRRKKVWELPGGLIDPGESPERCAARELLEETGQAATNLCLQAWLELEVPGNGQAMESRVRYGALYCANVSSVAPFEGNDEIEAIGWWPTTAPPKGTSAIDAALLAYCVERSLLLCF